MEFILRIFFAGLIAFVPDPQGTEVTVLIVDARQGYAISDGTWLPEHKPLLLVGAAECKGPCLEQQERIAGFMHPGDAAATRRLKNALGNGAAWELRDSDLGFEFQPVEQQGSRIHFQGKADRERFDWVAALAEIEPGAGSADPDLFRDRPRKGLVVSRLRLNQGTLKSYKLISLEDKVVPVAFRPIRELAGPRNHWPQDDSRAVAEWTVAEIKISSPSVTVHETDFHTGARRSIELFPKLVDGERVIEMALLNVPQDTFDPLRREPELVGKHFEIFYELLAARPPQHQRPVPYVPLLKEDYELPVAAPEESAFLARFGLRVRGPYARPLGPLARLIFGITEVSSGEK